MGGQTATYLDQWETFNMKEFIQQRFTLQWKDNQSINKLERKLKIMKCRGTDEEAREYKLMLEEELKENIVIPIKKEQIKWYNLTFMIKKANGKWRKILDAKALNKQKADFHFKMHDSIEVKQTIRLGNWITSLGLSSAFHHLIVQTESQPYLAFEFQNNHYTYKAMPFGTKHSPIYFATAMEPIMQQIRIKTQIRIISYVNDILLLHQNKEYLKNMTWRVIDTLKYFGFIINTEKSVTEPNLIVIFLGWEWNLANATVKTKPKKQLLLSHDLNNMRRWIKTGTEITVKQTAKLKGKLNYLRLQFQEASLFLNIMDHQKAQAARLRGWKTTMTINKTAIPDINWQITKLRANTPAQLIQIPPQMTMTTDEATSGCGSSLERELEMIAIAHGTWNKRQVKLTSINREIKAITQGPRSFAKTLKNSRVQSLAIRNDNSTAVFDIRKWIISISLIKEIKQIHQTIEKLGIQIQITHLPGVKNEIADALSRLPRAGDYKLKEKIFRQTCLQMNLNPTIDSFSQHFNNLLPRLMSTIRGQGEIAIDALNQTKKMELPWIHPPISLLPAVLKKIREEQMEAMIIAPLWPGQIWYTELVNENAQSLMLGWSNEILEPGTSLIKKNLKLHPGKICCFLMD
ncbi:MAG: putative reverse transcriptase [Streblomastix strix]|uniref:Putative reverse transcriptase n=1 Tax=Streblomastix strix TaxID=222440 RepID=A0A5J4UQQ4_9EUKA|nr:MAG: putative reverse transcriptase [Streblomastix strix]